jgi:hypothetical protein
MQLSVDKGKYRFRVVDEFILLGNDNQVDVTPRKAQFSCMRAVDFNFT